MERSDNTMGDSAPSPQQSSDPGKPRISNRTPATARRRILTWLLVLVVIAGVIVAVVSGVKKGKADAANKVEPPQVATTSKGRWCTEATHSSMSILVPTKHS
jgi:hypothetical protein